METDSRTSNAAAASARSSDGLTVVPYPLDEIAVNHATSVSLFKEMFAKFNIVDADFPPSGVTPSIVKGRPRLARLNADYATPEAAGKIHEIRRGVGDIRDALWMIYHLTTDFRVGFEWQKLRANPGGNVVIGVLGSPVRKDGLLFYPIIRASRADGGAEQLEIQLVLDGGQLKWRKGNYVIVV